MPHTADARPIALTLLLALAATAHADDEHVLRVVGTDDRAQSDVTVVARVKAWPEGSFQIRDHVLESDRKGRIELGDAIPAGGRFGLWSGVLQPGRTLAARYDWSADGAPVQDLRLVTGKADGLRLRFVDDDRPVEGVQVYPVVRAEADGTRHELGAMPPERLLVESDRKGYVELDHFLAGEWVAVQVRFPGAEWERRYLSVPTDKKPVVTIPREAPVTPDRDLLVGDDPDKRYFLMGPKAADTEPEEGWGLILVLPGGPGGADFHGWVRERYDDWVDRGYVMAQLVSKHWRPSPPIVWPTEKSPLEEMEFTTEEFVDQVVEAVAEQVKLDRRRVFTVSWSSSGPACYVVASRKKTPVTGSLIVMSVFRRELLDSTKALRGRPFFLLHSPSDAKCPLRLAEQGRDALLKHRAEVEWRTYEGGHGWAGDSIQQTREGLRWLHDRQD